MISPGPARASPSRSGSAISSMRSNADALGGLRRRRLVLGEGPRPRRRVALPARGRGGCVAVRSRGAARSQPDVGGIRALARAVDAKDHSTQLHSERVANLSKRLAVALGWSARRAVALHETALIHDVGKLALPNALLFTPRRLTAAEYDDGEDPCATWSADRRRGVEQRTTRVASRPPRAHRRRRLSGRPGRATPSPTARACWRLPIAGM